MTDRPDRGQLSPEMPPSTSPGPPGATSPPGPVPTARPEPLPRPVVVADPRPSGPSGPDLAGPPIAEFAATFRQHHDYVWRVLRHFGVPLDTVDDKVQDVFLVLHRRWSDYDPNSSMRSWLYGIARRVAADLRRGSARAERRLRAVPDPPPPLDPDQAVAQAEAAAFVERFLDSLDHDKREVFMLAEIEHFTAPEIAEATGAKLNTVYSRLRAARALFDRALRRFAPTGRPHVPPR